MRQLLLDGPPLPSRIKGKAQLIRRLRGLLIAVERFGRGRAITRKDVLWAARFLDNLTTALEGALDGAEKL